MFPITVNQSYFNLKNNKIKGEKKFRAQERVPPPKFFAEYWSVYVYEETPKGQKERTT